MRPAGPGEPVDVEPPGLPGLVSSGARLEVLYDGAPWTEGAVWWDDRLVFSDIIGRRVLTWAADGSVRTLVDPSEFANGHAVTPDGRLVQCEHGRRAISEVHADGSTTVLADRFDGHRLNSPNDITLARDGGVWFTDPTFGITNPQQGYPAASELGHTSVYRLDPSGRLDRMADLDQPNGLAFSPDESVLYVSQTPPDGVCQINVFDHDRATHRLSNRRRFVQVPHGIPDGFLVDASGRLWTSAQDGVHVYGPDGDHLGGIPAPGTVSNLSFDGSGDVLFLTGERLWGIRLAGGAVVSAVGEHATGDVGPGPAAGGRAE